MNALVSAPLSASQPIETVSDTSVVWSETASGVSYYGYRLLSPKMGRWINRDPIEEAGGHNLFAFVFNSPTVFVDPVGDSVYELPIVKVYDLPPTPEKCARIRWIISRGASLDAVNKRLWDAWISGTGNPGVSFDEFDTEGVRAQMDWHLSTIVRGKGLEYGKGLECETSGVVDQDKITTHPVSSHRMINRWKYSFWYLVTAEKTCEPCCEITVHFQWKHEAFDITNFNDGLDPNGERYSFVGGGFRIFDELVNACNRTYNWGAKDFEISAEEEGKWKYSWSCDK